MMKTKIAQKMALAQTNGFFSAFRIPTSSLLMQTATHMIYDATSKIVEMRPIKKNGNILVSTNRSIFAILKIGIRYLAQICSRVKGKKKVEMTLFALVTAAILDF